MPAYSERFDEGCNIERNVVWKRKDIICGDCACITKSAAPARKSNESTVVTSVFEMKFAGSTCAIVDCGLD
jgi:hypothetical protein